MTNRTNRTSREQNIEQVAGLIAEHIRDGYGWTIEDSQRTNADGWTIEVRYDYQEYSDQQAHAMAERIARA